MGETSTAFGLTLVGLMLVVGVARVEVSVGDEVLPESATGVRLVLSASVAAGPPDEVGSEVGAVGVEVLPDRLPEPVLRGVLVSAGAVGLVGAGAGSAGAGSAGAGLAGASGSEVTTIGVVVIGSAGRSAGRTGWD